MFKKIFLSTLVLFFVYNNALFAQIASNRDSVYFKPTNELQLDSSLIVLHNNSAESILIRDLKFFNTLGSSAFYTNPLSDSVIQSKDSVSFYIYFKPRHNIFHNSELLVITKPSCFSFSIDLKAQGKFSIPYYANTENKSEEDLKTSLKSIISAGYVSLGYNLARDNMFMTIDNQRVNGQGASVNSLECIYTGKKSLAYNTRTESQTNDNFNTEHTFPQSLFSQNEPMRSDLHHLFPTNDAANNSRSNYPFGVATTPYVNDAVNNPSHLGSNTLYEPRDVQKGRTARAMMYFVIRYQDYSNFFLPQESILRKWNIDFPPNQIDKKRNADIQTVQKNRNPFVDYPQFAERINKLSGTSTSPIVKSIYVLDSIQTNELSDTTDSVVLYFPIINTGNKSVLIYNGISTNTLVDFNFDSVRVQPGESVSLPIIIHTKDTSGIFTSGLQFYTDYSLIFLYSRLNFNIKHNTVGIQNIDSKKIQVFPNPVVGNWLIVNSNETKDSRLGTKTIETEYGLFYNLAGQLVLTSPIVDNKINVGELVPGFYTLKTSLGYAKIIKQ